jgi:hypothetical protein
MRVDRFRFTYGVSKAAKLNLYRMTLKLAAKVMLPSCASLIDFVFIFLLLFMVGMLVARPTLTSHGKSGIFFGRVLVTIRSQTWLLIVHLWGWGGRAPQMGNARLKTQPRP